MKKTDKIIVYITVFLIAYGAIWSSGLIKEVKQDEADLIAYTEETVEILPEIGVASWYDYDLRREDQKCREENFPCYSEGNDTAASRDYPRGTKLKVSRGDKSVIVRVNDYVENPKVIIDLSSYAFQKLAPLSLGLIEVEIEELD
ncbi:MAG: hypothetical protein HOG49_13510 [Candidatus Scalindua sp.]|nr:hypothetical protein [Candidatus Scalindua sp.]